MSSLNARQPQSDFEPAPHAVPLSAPGLRAVVDTDAPVPSPAAAMQARLAAALQPQARRGFDPVPTLLVVFCLAAWWGAFSLTAAILHAYRG